MVQEGAVHLLQEAIRLLLGRLQLAEAGAVKKHPSLVEPVGLEEVVSSEITQQVGQGLLVKGMLEALVSVVGMASVVVVVAQDKPEQMLPIPAEAMVAMDSARRSQGRQCITQEVVVEVDGLDMSMEVSVDWVGVGIVSAAVSDSLARQTLAVAGQEEMSEHHHVEAVRVAVVS